MTATRELLDRHKEGSACRASLWALSHPQPNIVRDKYESRIDVKTVSENIFCVT